METTERFFAVQKPLIFYAKHYGCLKVSIRQSIQRIAMDAWFSLEKGWIPLTVQNDKGETVPKPKKDWTACEKKATMYNSQALSVILGSLQMNQFTCVQGCVSPKEAWDILHVSFEGTSNVKRTRLDILASKFNTLTMGESVPVDDFNSMLSSLSQEASVLGKKYKEKKLVKKFLRSLPEIFQSHKSAIDVSLNQIERLLEGSS